MRFAYALPLLLSSLTGCYDPGDLGDVPYKCSATFPDCPDNYTCDLTQGSKTANRCVRAQMMAAMLTFPTKPSVYMGPTAPNNLNANNCPDMNIEPNNDIAHATPNYDTGGQQINLAVCPAGDVDVFLVNTVSNFVKFEINYFDIKQGDLDIVLFKDDGTPLLSDLDAAKSTACVATSTALNGNYYAVVVGAKNAMGGTDTNRYSLTVTKDMAKLQCGVQASPDMTMPLPDLSL
jgi:hypothetical protein